MPNKFSLADRMHKSILASQPFPPTPEQFSEMRRLAYSSEADPLFFKVQRGEATHEEWLAKIAEIKERYV